MSVLDDIIAERNRQIELGYDAEHDDEHTNNQLARAAASYAVGGGLFKIQLNVPLQVWPYQWYYEDEKTEREKLVIAAALLVAEIERLDRFELEWTDGT